MALRILGRKNLIPTFSGGLGSGHLRGLQTFSLPDLAYDYGALEPVINAEIMQLHHQKHHQAYITNYNKALEQLHEAINKGHTSTVVKLQSAIKFNGGVYLFSSLIYLQEGGGEPPKGSLGWAIDSQFGSLEALIQRVNAEGAALQGSGWVWLALDKELKKLSVETTANQYKNVRPDYLKNIWKVINWKYAGEIFAKEAPLVESR
ncbi:superoxide dismutase [Mn], mitochondrial-like isoform X6 [Cucumis melo]|uniref:Superoxide dismutase n=1 Tax=Cucumis melo TaxID=3656 RepID=A0ABM3KEW7_CUCME|nr:superoxide dismutase [Mn], mitochondrial-like isoform X6 [Cucumis melo]